MNGPIRWFIENPIAANLLMVFFIVGGLVGIPMLDKQYFPEFKIDKVHVVIAYPGAGPKEVEKQICQRIEEAIHDLAGIKEIRATASQSMGSVMIEAESGYDMQRLTAEIKTRVDAINTFPADAERPLVYEIVYKHRMVSLALSGNIGERNLKELGERLREDLASLNYVSMVEIQSPRPYEVSIELSETALRRYGLTFEDVVNVIRKSSLNLPAGSIKADSGDIRLQTRGQAYKGYDFEQISLMTRGDGTKLLVGDVATVVDGFEDQKVKTRRNGVPSHNLQVFVTSNPNTLKTTETVQDWIGEIRPTLPEGVELNMWRDASKPFQDRVGTLLKNGLGGLLLVFLVLMLFLSPKLALWVCTGILVAFMGTLALLPYTGISLNMISLFAFLLILGIVVDDAIIVGESIYTKQTQGDTQIMGALNGARGVLKPVMFAVISTMIFFVPMFFMPGEMAQTATSIPVVVIIALSLSLVECLLILPAHLAYINQSNSVSGVLTSKFDVLRVKCAGLMKTAGHHYYKPLLERSLRNSSTVIALFISALLLSLSIYGGGWMRTGFFPNIVSNDIAAEIELPEGGPFSDTERIMLQVESAAHELRSRYPDDENGDPKNSGFGAIMSWAQDNNLWVRTELKSRDLDAPALANEWRELMGDIVPVKNIEMDYTINRLGKPISLILTSNSMSDLKTVSSELKNLLKQYPGVYDIGDTFDSARDEIILNLKPAAENLGITLSDVARQVRYAFHGAEAQRIPRAKEDVRVMVRYPDGERLAVENLREMRIKSPGGIQVPFDTVAEISFEPGYVSIDRLDRRRILEVWANVVPGASVPREIVAAITKNHLPEWKARFPDLNLNLDGELEEAEAFRSAMMKYMFLSMLVIYALMAIVFHSYWQPFLVLTAIPFGLMGAIFGHLILNWQVSMFSLLGVIACSGVVVNDNLVLIDRINQLREEGSNLYDSLVKAGTDRFRPIILTSITTFIGLLPIMSETSIQAQFLIPMVTSLAFGVLFATGVTLLLVPCLYVAGERLKEIFSIATSGIEGKIS